VTDEMIESALEQKQKRSLPQKYPPNMVASPPTLSPDKFYLTIQGVGFSPEAEKIRGVLQHPASNEERLNAAKKLKEAAPEMVKVAIGKTRKFYLQFPEIFKSLNPSRVAMEIKESF
jgi:hypothetical protein